MDNVDPVTELPRKHFTRLPLWWVAVAANGCSELMNLAALGFAPATLVAPLGCLTGKHVVSVAPPISSVT